MWIFLENPKIEGGDRYVIQIFEEKQRRLCISRNGSLWIYRIFRKKMVSIIDLIILENNKTVNKRINY